MFRDVFGGERLQNQLGMPVAAFGFVGEEKCKYESLSPKTVSGACLAHRNV